MKWLLVLSSVLVAYSNAQETCYADTVQGCDNKLDDNLKHCNALYGGFIKNVTMIQEYANEHIGRSFEYLLIAANFGTYAKNRPGFEKQFRSLSDRSWNNGIDLIKHITKRGGAHDFKAISPSVQNEDKHILDVHEIQALALVLDHEKKLALKAHHIHEKYSHANHQSEYDPEIAHFIEEEFFENQASTIRKLSGYANDLKKMFKDTTDISLSLYMFDEYLTKQ